MSNSWTFVLVGEGLRSVVREASLLLAVNVGGAEALGWIFSLSKWHLPAPVLPLFNQPSPQLFPHSLIQSTSLYLDGYDWAARLLTSLQARGNLSCIPHRLPTLLPSCQKQSWKAESLGALDSALPSQASHSPDRRLPQLQRPRAACTSDRQEGSAKYWPPPHLPHSALLCFDRWRQMGFLSCSTAGGIKLTGGLFPVQIIIKNPAPTGYFLGVCQQASHFS